MTITLKHTIVPARDKIASARFFARIFGLGFEEPSDHFAPVRVNDRLTQLFDQDETFESHHWRTARPRPKPWAKAKLGQRDTRAGSDRRRRSGEGSHGVAVLHCPKRPPPDALRADLPPSGGGERDRPAHLFCRLSLG